MYRLTRIAAVTIGAMVTVTACRRQRPAAPPPTPVVNQDSIDAARARADSIARADAARRDSIARADEDRLRAERERALAEVRATLSAPIYFDYDSDALRDEARSALDAKLAILNANPSLRIRIAGHTDERGSDEYNLALGQRRAASAKRYLTQRGIADDRIEVLSYGEERPAG